VTDTDENALFAENERLKSALKRAYECLIDGRRVGDAMKVLQVAAPTITRQVAKTVKPK